MSRPICEFIAVAVVIAFTHFISGASAAERRNEGSKGSGVNWRITAVDADGETITVGGEADTVDNTTIITRKGRVARVEALKTGMEAQISTFTLGERLTTVGIKVGQAPAVAAPVPPRKKN